MSTHHLLGPSLGHRKHQGSPSQLPPRGLLAGSPEAACTGAGCGGLKVGAGSPGPWLREAAGPAPLSFYELQREAKFPQPPNETESKSELIGNRRAGEGWLGKAGACSGVRVVCVSSRVQGRMCECDGAEYSRTRPRQQ